MILQHFAHGLMMLDVPPTIAGALIYILLTHQILSVTTTTTVSSFVKFGDYDFMIKV